MTDVAAPAVAIGIAIGRIGCFLNGCCYGAVCDLPWAVCFPAGSHAWARQVDAGLISPLAEPFAAGASHANLWIARGVCRCSACCWLTFPADVPPGEAMALLMIVYPLTRWPLEALRGDEPAIFAGMTLSQNISVGLFAVRAGACGLCLRGGCVSAAGRSARRRRCARLSGSICGLGVGPGIGTRTGRRRQANKGKMASGRRDSEGAGQNRST